MKICSSRAIENKNKTFSEKSALETLYFESNSKKTSALQAAKLLLPIFPPFTDLSKLIKRFCT